MASDLLVKGLLRQAGISVLAGLLLSSAALAEDIAGGAGDQGEVSVGIDGGGPDVAVDPTDDGDLSEGEDGAGDDGAGDDGAGDDGAGDDGAGDGETAGDDDGAVTGEEGVEPGVEDGTGEIDESCAACSGMPDDVGEPIAMEAGFGTTSVQRDAVGGGAAGPTGGRDVGRDQGDKGRGAGRDGDLGTHRRLIVN